jgi:carbamoyl-phosphate synthase large subunit
MNILITSAGRRVSLVRAFKKVLLEFDPEGKVFTVDMKPDLSAACQVSDAFFSVPGVNDPDYCNIVSDICELNSINLIIPTIDTELIILSKNIDYFKNRGIQPIVSSPDVIMMCRDKRKTNEYFDSIGFPRAKEIDIHNPHFPIFAKPYDGSSSIGIEIIRKASDLKDSFLKNEKMMFLEYLNPSEYDEFTIDMYFDKNHFLKCAVPRERIEVRTGEVSKGVTRKNNIYDFVCKKFSFCKGFIGCITLQVFKNKISGEIIGIEINPRFGGGYPLSFIAKANFPEMIIKEYFFNEDLTFYEGWVENLLMLRYDDEIIVNDFKG